MNKTAAITTRVDPELKASAEQVLSRLGMTTAQAITMFLKQVELNQGLPFTPRLPVAPAKPPKPYARQNIFDYAGVAEGRTYSGAEAADAYISQQRDEWER